MAEKKYVGRDCELSTTGMWPNLVSIEPWIVTCEVLHQLGAAAAKFGAVVWSRAMSAYQPVVSPSATAHSIDCLRHWTSGGQCYYADMAHLEVCTATSLEPLTFAAQSFSTLVMAETARELAQQEADPGVRYDLAASNADLSDPSISFGSHISVSVSKALWENLFVEPHHTDMLGYVASVMAAAIPFFGAGYLWPRGDDRVTYSLSARAHHLSKIRTLATTEKWGRGLLNSRRESHGGPHERLHLIGFDFSVINSALLASLLQTSLAAAEEGFCGLKLADPVAALRLWSWNVDPASGLMRATAALTDGRQMTLPEYVRELARILLRMCEGRLIAEQVAPGAQTLLPRIIDLSHYVAEGSLVQSAKHLDWAAKLLYLLNCGGRFQDPEMRLADHDFSNTNPEVGAIWRLWERGLIDPLIDLDDLKHSLTHAPEESRDWGRGQLIQQFHSDITAVNWSYVEMYANSSRYSPRMRIEFPQLERSDDWRLAIGNRRLGIGN